MQIITGDNVSKAVDYSFGDHFSLWNTLPGAFTKFANANNREFLDKAKEFEGKFMTLYIDNLRLYARPVKTDTDNDKSFVNFLMMTNNLLALCSLLPSNGFIIFTGQEDTPIDDQIQLPLNVAKVFAVNAVYNTDQVVPFPFGLQRKMTDEDNRLDIMLQNIGDDTEPKKLLYINMGIGRNPDRQPIAKFETNNWVTTRFDENSKFFPYEKYQDFLDEIKNHKYMLCPQGHGMDTHRVWEALYLRRVPVMKRHPYYEKLMAGFPVLFVDDWSDVTEELLTQSDLYARAQTMSLDELDLVKLMEKCCKI